MKLTKAEQVLVGGSKDDVLDFMDGNAAIVDSRGSVSSIVKAFAPFLPWDFIQLEEGGDRVVLRTKSGTARVRLGESGAFGLDVAAAITAILPPDFEARAYVPLVKEGTHLSLYFVRRSSWWKAFRAEHPGRYRWMFGGKSPFRPRYELGPPEPMPKRVVIVSPGYTDFLRDEQTHIARSQRADMPEQRALARDLERRTPGEAAYTIHDLANRSIQRRACAAWLAGRLAPDDVPTLRIAGLLAALSGLLELQFHRMPDRANALTAKLLIALFVPRPASSKLIDLADRSSFRLDDESVGVPTKAMQAVLDDVRKQKLSMKVAVSSWARRTKVVRDLSMLDYGWLAFLPIEPLLATDAPLPPQLTLWQPLRDALAEPLPRMTVRDRRYYEWCHRTIERLFAIRLPKSKEARTGSVAAW